MAEIRNKADLSRRPLSRAVEAVDFLSQLAPDLEDARGELMILKPGGELSWEHREGEAFFLTTQGSVEVDLVDRRETLQERSLLWLEPGDRVVLRNPGQAEAELLYLQAR